jgi:PadR family transcriptional regulator AphA
VALRHVLLGMLTEERASGYELSRRFARPPWRYLWHAQASQIYTELQAMAANGLITEVARGRRRRRTYAITQAGATALQQWLARPTVQSVVRNEPALRLLLVAGLDSAGARALLEPLLAESARDVQRLRVAAASAAPAVGRGQLPFERRAAELSLRTVEALNEWMRWALGELPPA